MKHKITYTLILLLITTFAFGQMTKRDSLVKMCDSIKVEIARLKKLTSGCSDFKIYKTPIWVGKDLDSKTYYRNCMWSGTYIVINSDSTFLYRHNGEGSANYLVMGNWIMKNDSIIVLTGSDKLTKEFLVNMKRFETTNYRASKPFSREFIRHKDALLEYEE